MNSIFLGGFVYSPGLISMLYSEAIVSQMETHQAAVSFTTRSHTKMLTYLLRTIKHLSTDNQQIYGLKDKPRSRSPSLSQGK